MRRHWIWYAFKAALFISLGLLLFGWLIMMLWNAVIPAAFSGPAITFGQAVGIFVLARLLVWGLQPAWQWRHLQHGRSYWRRRWEKRLSAMTPEEREKLRQAYARRCGRWYTEVPKEEPAQEETVNH